MRGKAIRPVRRYVRPDLEHDLVPVAQDERARVAAAANAVSVRTHGTGEREQAIGQKGAYQPQKLPPPTTTQTVDGYRFTLHGKPQLRAIQAAFLSFTVTGPDGAPAQFTPWYGAFAHPIFFRRRSLDYFHTHVCAPGAANCTSLLGGAKVTGRSSTPGKLTVGVLVPVGGTWRLFLQCLAGGHVLTAPFTLQVR